MFKWFTPRGEQYRKILTRGLIKVSFPSQVETISDDMTHDNIYMKDVLSSSQNQQPLKVKE